MAYSPPPLCDNAMEPNSRRRRACCRTAPPAAAAAASFFVVRLPALPASRRVWGDGAREALFGELSRLPLFCLFPIRLRRKPFLFPSRCPLLGRAVSSRCEGRGSAGLAQQQQQQRTRGRMERLSLGCGFGRVLCLGPGLSDGACLPPWAPRPRHESSHRRLLPCACW